MENIRLVADRVRFAEGKVGVSKEIYNKLLDVSNPSRLIVIEIVKDEETDTITETEVCNVTNAVYNKLTASPVSKDVVVIDYTKAVERYRQLLKDRERKENEE